jgi:hypothetical protein
MTKCKHPECNTISNFNYLVMTFGMFCSKHKLVGMVDIVNKRCQQPYCKKIIPGFNLPDKKLGIFCATHKKLGMVNIKTNKCIEKGCDISCVFNYPNKKSGMYCAWEKYVNNVFSNILFIYYVSRRIEYP